MTTTAQVINTPRNRPIQEFEHWCLGCGGPLRLHFHAGTSGRLIPVWVHARHRDWQRDPHQANPVAPASAPPQEGVWRELGLLER